MISPTDNFQNQLNNRRSRHPKDIKYQIQINDLKDKYQSTNQQIDTRENQVTQIISINQT